MYTCCRSCFQELQIKHPLQLLTGRPAAHLFLSCKANIMCKCMQAPALYQRRRSCRVVDSQAPAELPQPHAAVRTTLTLPIALGLYGLRDSELLWELQLDTRCLMGWNDSKIVLAFRGTASFTNAWSDLQVGPCSAAACDASLHEQFCLHAYLVASMQRSMAHQGTDMGSPRAPLAPQGGPARKFHLLVLLATWQWQCVSCVC